MKISDELKMFLSGEKFSNGLKINCTEINENLSRIEWLEKLCLNKKIVHVGACDHLPIIQSKINDNKWLHKRLMDACEKVIGVDIDQRAVEFCNELGYDNIKKLDFIADSYEIRQWMSKESNTNFDLILMGEILEHLNNPVDFLMNIKKEYLNFASEVIVTVPNVYCYKYSNFAKNGIECINTDHKYNFSPFTLSKVLLNAGMEPINIIFADFPSKKRSWLMRNKQQLYIANTLICVAKL